MAEAVDELDGNQDNFGAADLFYGGDLDSWRRFGNSLRLRLAIRISEAAPALAQQVVTELMTEDYLIESNTSGAHFQPIAGIWHPFFELDNTGQGMYNPSQFLIDHLKVSDDPRIGIFAEPTLESVLFGNDDWAGVPNLQTSGQLSSFNSFNISAVGDRFLDGSTRGTTLGYAEVCFLKAEACFRGWGSGQTAADNYDQGVRAHMEYLGIADTAIVSFLAGPGAYDGTLEQIITQKWLTFVYRDGYEGFSELRRTGYPVLVEVGGNPLDQSQLPQRLPYPPSEVTLNSTNVNAVGEGIGEMETPVWWAQ